LRHVTYTKVYFRTAEHNILELQPEVTGISSCFNKLNTLFDKSRHKHTNAS